MGLAAVPNPTAPRKGHAAQPTRYTGQDLNHLPGMTLVHCIGCGVPIFEYRAAVIRHGAGIRRALVILRCKSARCHQFTRFEMPEEEIASP